jgi:hypothetical protein
VSKSLFLIAVGLLAALCGLSACGGGGDQPLSRAEYLKRGEGICRKASKEQFAAFKEGLEEMKNGKFSPVGKREIEQLTTQVMIPRAKQMVNELAALEAPEGNEHVVEELITEFRKAIKKAEASSQSFLSGKAFAEADEAAKGYGLESCRV